MASLSHLTPGNLMENEEKWFNFLSVKNLIGIGVMSLPGGFIFIILSAFGLKVAGAICWFFLAAIGYALTSIKLPVEGNQYSGGGLYLYMIVLRVIFRRLTRVTYVKNYNYFMTAKGDSDL